MGARGCSVHALGLPWQQPTEVISRFASSSASGFDFLAEDLLEVANQHFRWATLDDVPEFLVEPGRDQAVEPAYA